MKSTRRGAPEVGAEIFATLLHSPRTWTDVKAQVGLLKGSGGTWLKQMRASGILRICGWTRTNGRGRYARIFELQRPFDRPDAPHPLKEDE